MLSNRTTEIWFKNKNQNGEYGLKKNLFQRNKVLRNKNQQVSKMTTKAILLTLLQIHTNDIFKGSSVKNHEYRKNPPKATFPLRAIMYVSRETNDKKSKPVRQVVGEFMMGAVDGEITSVGYPLPISGVIKYKEPIPWKMVKNKIENPPRPQMNFVYIKPEKEGHQEFLELLEPHRREGTPIP